MRNEFGVCLFLGLIVLGLGLWMIRISLDPDELARTQVSSNGVEVETIEEKASLMRMIGLVLAGMSAVPMAILILVVKADNRRTTRIPLSIYCLLAGGGLGAVAFQAFQEPSASRALVAGFGLGSALLWTLAGVLLVPLLRAEEDVTSSF